MMQPNGLVICPDCGEKISEHSEICIKCGFPLQKFLKEHNITNISGVLVCPKCAEIYNGWDMIRYDLPQHLKCEYCGTIVVQTNEDIEEIFKLKDKEGKIYNKTYRLFASKNLQDSSLYKCKHEIGETITDDKGKSRKYNPEKFADTPEHCFIVNENIIGKKCSEYSNFDKQWYIDLAYDRLREQFHIDCKPSIFDDMF